MRAKWWMVLLIVLAVAALTIVPLSPPARVRRHHLWRTLTFAFPDDISGAIQASGKTLGDFRLQADECDSGDWRNFFGITFHDGSQPGYSGHISMPVDGEPMISLNAPAHDYAVAFFPSECAVWDVEVKHTWSLIRDSNHSSIQPMAGHARFNCYHPDTVARITGDLRFRYCR